VFKRAESPGGALVVLIPGGEIIPATQPLVDDLRSQLGSEFAMIDPWEMGSSKLQQTCLRAQLILAMGGSPVDWFKLFSEGHLPADPDLIVDEYSVFMAIGSLAPVLGEWTYDADSNQWMDGVGWFPRAIIYPMSIPPAVKATVQRKIESEQQSYALRIAPDTIFGVGVQGQIEIWSEVAPEILLGRGWT
jgi:hypothetical protein